MTDALPVGVAVPEAQALARFFHETYERLAPSFGYKTREASAVPWDDVPEQNRSLMVAVAAEVLQAFVVDGGLLSVVATLQEERDAIGAALGEPCAECGHVEWRSDGYLDAVLERELVALGEREARLREALSEVEGFLADPDGANPIDSIRLARQVIRAALVVVSPPPGEEET